MKAHPSGWAAYAALVLVLSLPFYAIGLAGVRLPYIPALPLTAVMVVVPAFVAIGMTGSRSGIRALLRQLWLWPGLVWVTAAIVFMPVALFCWRSWLCRFCPQWNGWIRQALRCRS